MLFSSNLFLFLFLPCVILGYYLLDKRLRNGFLLLVSLIFYGWGTGKIVLLMIGVILFNYIMALILDRMRPGALRKATLAADLEHMAALKEALARRLPQEVPGAKVVLQGQAPHILPITLPGYKSEVIVRFLSDRGICVSSGSACHKGKPSHVYAALKLPKKELDGVLRISFSYDTTPQDIDALLEGLKAAQEQLFTSLS